MPIIPARTEQEKQVALSYMAHKIGCTIHDLVSHREPFRGDASSALLRLGGITRLGHGERDLLLQLLFIFSGQNDDLIFIRHVLR